jgi:hypothetical protein
MNPMSKPGFLANSQTFEHLYTWLRRSPSHDLITDTCTNDLSKLCKTLDKQPNAYPPRIGLELHHFPQRKTDVSFFGDYTLLEHQEIRYPNFALQWREHISNHYPIDTFDDDIIAEFDHSTDGYHLMGLFQRCSPKDGSLNHVIKLIEFYADSRQHELKARSGNTNGRQSMSMLKKNFETLGPPTYIGFVDRNSTQIKIITQIDENNKQQAINYLEHHLRKNNEAGAELIANYLRQADIKTGVEAHARLSLDYDINHNHFSNRYALEYSGQSDHTRATHQINSLWLSQTRNTAANINGYKQSLDLSRCLPFGEKRPNANLLNEEIMIVKLHHSKLISSPTGALIKDYAMLFTFIKP